MRCLPRLSPRRFEISFVLVCIQVSLLYNMDIILTLGFLINMTFSEWILISFLRYLFTSFYMCLGVNMYTGTFSAHKSQKRALYPLELEFG